MKKLLAIIVLGLLFSGNAYALTYKEAENEWLNNGGSDGDPNQTVILESTKDYIVIRNTTAQTKIYHELFKIFKPANIFHQEADAHCKKNKVYIGSLYEIFDDHTVYNYCTSFLSTHEEFKNIKLSKSESSELQGLGFCLIHISCEGEFHNGISFEKHNVKKSLKKWPDAKKVAERIKAHNAKLTDSSFVFKIKKRALAKKDETDKIEMASMVKKAQATCKDLGFKEATPEYSNCSLKLYTQSIELAAKNKQQIVHTRLNTSTGNTSTGNAVSSGSNSVTIYDPVRDANRAIDRGMKMITGKCNDLAC
jgi:hypothetical protein